jgi:hypothetical protein
MNTLACLLLFSLCAGVAIADGPPDDLLKMSPEQLQKGIEDRHPAAYYVLAKKLFDAGKKDDAVFWFYAGQLRYRFHVSANPGLDPSGDPALLASLNDVVGRPINEWAFGDLNALDATIGRVLTWDEEKKNGFTSKKDHAEDWKNVRSGLGEMRTYMKDNAEQIRAQRTANGLANRS